MRQVHSITTMLPMAKLRALTAAFVLALPFTSSVASAVTVKEAFDSALIKTETISISKKQVAQAQERVSQAQSTYFPQVQGVLSQTRQDGSKTDQSIGKLSVSQSIYNGGRDAAKSDQNQNELAAQKETSKQDRLRLYYDVAKAFYEVLQADHELQNLDATAKLTEERVVELQKRNRIGKSRNGEVLTAESQLLVLSSQQAAARTQLESARNAFETVTGMDRTTKLDDVRNLPEHPKPIEYYLGKLEERPDLKALRFKASANENAISLARGGHFPKLDLIGNYYPYRKGLNEDVHWDTTLTLTLPLFEGGYVQSQVREASEGYMASELALKLAQRQSENEIKNAYQNLISALNQNTTLVKAVSAAERNYREQTKDYRFSLVTNLDVLQALNTYNETKRSSDRTRYQALIAWAQLNSATGQEP